MEGPWLKGLQPMMSLTEAEIQHLLRRAQLSLTRGYQIARAGDYATALGGTDGSPGGLVELCKAALAGATAPVDAPDLVDAPATEGEDSPPTWAPPAPSEGTAVESVAEPETAPAEDDASTETTEDDAGAGEDDQPAEGDSTEAAKGAGSRKKKRGRR